jgi:hypothetical protein
MGFTGWGGEAGQEEHEGHEREKYWLQNSVILSGGVGAFLTELLN